MSDLSLLNDLYVLGKHGEEGYYKSGSKFSTKSFTSYSSISTLVGELVYDLDTLIYSYPDILDSFMINTNTGETTYLMDVLLDHDVMESLVKGYKDTRRSYGHLIKYNKQTNIELLMFIKSDKAYSKSKIRVNVIKSILYSRSRVKRSSIDNDNHLGENI